MNDIKISIITVSLNSEKYIESNIRSVINQSYNGIEHIIIDGASSDSTLEIIKNYNKYITYWISEPDKGIADAMNKGIQVATGDYILFLNSDDYLKDDNVLKMVAENLKSGADIYIYKVLFLYPDGRTLISLNKGLGLLTNFKMGSCHQGQLISRELLLDLNMLDVNIKINFDYDFLLRAYRSGATSETHDIIVSVMRQVGISSRRDWVGFITRYNEEKLIHNKNCNNFYMSIIYKIYWVLYVPYRYSRYLLINLNRKYLKNKSIKFLQ